VLWRVRVGRDGRADLQLCHPNADLVVEVNARRRRVAGNLHTAVFGLWWMLTGILADRFGRVLMLQVTIAWFAGFTFLQGLSAGFAWLLVARSLQGLGFGREWAAGSVLAAELFFSRFAPF
jgi:MFS family permease